MLVITDCLPENTTRMWLSSGYSVSTVGYSQSYVYYLQIILMAYSKCTPGTLSAENLLVGSVELKGNGLGPMHRKDVILV